MNPEDQITLSWKHKNIANNAAKTQADFYLNFTNDKKMARPRSAATQSALDDIKIGLTAYAACKKHGVSQSVISKILNKPDDRTCPCCNQKIRFKQI